MASSGAMADFARLPTSRKVLLFVVIAFIGGFLYYRFVYKGLKEDVAKAKNKQQQAINARYTQAAKDIEQLKQLEDQKQQMLGKAELTTSLIEKAPRSLLMAELVNRMPENLTLLELELASKKVEAPRERPVYSVSFFCKACEPARRDTWRCYGVRYAPGRDGERGYIQIPKPGDAEYYVNVRTIYRGVEGQWFRATENWDALMRAHLAAPTR